MRSRDDAARAESDERDEKRGVRAVGKGARFLFPSDQGTIKVPALLTEGKRVPIFIGPQKWRAFFVSQTASRVRYR
jgi:hypothetical protein